VCELSASINGLARRMWCVQAGTAVSSRIRCEAPNSVNLVEFGLVEFGLVEFGLVEFGLVEFGLVEFGLVEFGLGMAGLSCSVERWD
jgi:hypothetical protein